MKFAKVEVVLYPVATAELERSVVFLVKWPDLPPQTNSGSSTAVLLLQLLKALDSTESAALRAAPRQGKIVESCPVPGPHFCKKILLFQFHCFTDVQIKK